MKHRNKKGRYNHKIDYYKFSLFGLILLLVSLFLIVTQPKWIDNDVKVNAQQITIIPTITPSPIVINVSPTPTQKLTIQQKICNKFGDKCLDALSIAFNESHFQNIKSHKPNKNNTYDWGVFQINEIHCKKLNLGGDCTKLLDEDINIQMALLISGNGNSWKAWSTCNTLPKCY